MKSDNKELEDKITALGQVGETVESHLIIMETNEIISGDEIPERCFHCPRQ